MTSPHRLVTLLFVLTSMGGLMPGCSRKAPLEVVPSVDLHRYQGLWYEIARYPHWFEKDCVGATAFYTLRDDGTVEVVNRCFRDTLDGEPREARAKAWSTDRNSNAKLKVRFFWPFTGKYWVIGLAEDYSHVVVGEPSREYLWILSRSPSMEEPLYQSILADLVTKGYDISRLERPPQKQQAELEQASRELLQRSAGQH